MDVRDKERPPEVCLNVSIKYMNGVDYESRQDTLTIPNSRDKMSTLLTSRLLQTGSGVSIFQLED